MHVILHAAGQELVEAAIANTANDRDDDRLLHVRGGDSTDDDAATAAVVGGGCCFLGAHYLLAVFWACVSMPCLRPLSTVRIWAISRRLVFSRAEDVT